MNAKATFLSSPSAQKLAQLLKRAEGVWLASPSLALLSVLVAARPRPARLMVRDGSPSSVANVGHIVGAAPETVDLDDTPALRKTLQSLGASPERAWGVATHVPDALVSSDWFEAFAARGVPTIELCLGGLFDLARERPRDATVTLVSLDDEPAFAGVQLTALLTNDNALAQRVRELSLTGSQSAESILDATPRGLAEDEAGLLALIERVIEREQARRARGPRTRGAGESGGLNLTWKRLFQEEGSEPAAPGRPATVPARSRPPQGRSAWLERIAETETQHQDALSRLNAALESAKTESAASAAQAQSVIDELVHQVEESDRSATRTIEEISVALKREQQRAEAIEKKAALLEEAKARDAAEAAAFKDALTQRQAALAAAAQEAEARATRLHKETLDQKQSLEHTSQRYEVLSQKFATIDQERQAVAGEARHREARLEAEIAALREDRDRTQQRLVSAVARNTRDEAKLAKSAAEAEEIRLALANRIRDDDEARAVSASAMARLQSQVEQTAARETAVSAERDAAKVRFQQAEQERRAAVLVADERAVTFERERSEAAARAAAASAEWQQRLDAAASTAARDAKRLEVLHADVVAHYREELTGLRQQAEASGEAHVRELASMTERNLKLEEQGAALATERADALSRLRELEETSREAARVAGERVAALQVEKAEEASRAAAFAVEWPARLEASEKSAAQTLHRVEARHRAELTRVQGEVAEARTQGSAAALAQAQAAVSFEQRIAEGEKTLDAALSERDQVRFVLNRVEREKAEEASLLRAALAQATLLEAEVVGLRRQAKTAMAEHASQSLDLEKRLSVAETERSGLDKEREEILSRLKETEARHRQDLLASEKRVLALEREKTQEVERLNKTVAAWQTRFETAAKAALKDAQDLEARQAAAVARLEEKAARFKEQAEALSREGKSFSRQVTSLEKDKALLVAAREAGEAGLRQAEERYRESVRRAEERASAEAELRRQAELVVAEKADRLLVLEKRISVIETEKAREAERLNGLVADAQSQLERAASAALREVQDLEARHTAAVARLEEAAASRAGHFEAELKGLLQQHGAASLAQAAEANALRERLAVLQVEKIEELSRLQAVMADLTSRATSAAALHESETGADRERMSALQKETAQALLDRSDFEARLQHAEQLARSAELARVEEVARLQAAVAETESRLSSASAVHSSEQIAARERVAGLEREIAQAASERQDLQTQLRVAEQQGASSQVAKVEDAARLQATVAELESRLSAAAAIQSSQAEAARERVASLEGAKAQADAQHQAAQARLLQVEEQHREELRQAAEAARIATEATRSVAKAGESSEHEGNAPPLPEGVRMAPVVLAGSSLLLGAVLAGIPRTFEPLMGPTFHLMPVIGSLSLVAGLGALARFRWARVLHNALFALWSLTCFLTPFGLIGVAYHLRGENHPENDRFFAGVIGAAAAFSVLALIAAAFLTMLYVPAPLPLGGRVAP